MRYRAFPGAERFDRGYGAHEALGLLALRGSEPPAPITICVRLAGNEARSCLGDLEREIATQRGALGRDERVSQLRWGGDAATALGIGELSRLMERLRGFFDLPADVDCAFEADASLLSPDFARSLAALGFNEASIRAAHSQDASRALEAVRAAGFTAVALEGVPRLPEGSGVETVVGLRPERISLDAADDDDAARLGRMVERLVREGYVHLGYDRFALAEDELAHARLRRVLYRGPWGYSARPPGDVLGFGPAALSRVGDAYGQNHDSPEAYRSSLERGALPVARGLRLDADGVMRRDVIERLSCVGDLDFAALALRYGVDPVRYFAAELSAMDELERDGVVERSASGLSLTESGRYVIGAVCLAFDRRAPAPGSP